MNLSSEVNVSKIPMMARRFGSAIVSLLSFTAVLVWTEVLPGQTEQASVAPLRESDVVRLARSSAPASLVADAAQKVAVSRVRASGLHPNPSFVWARESVNTGPEGGRGSQDLLGFNVPLDISRPRAQRSLAEAEGAWMRVEASLSKTEAVLEAVLAYYDVAFSEERVLVLSVAVENLEEATRVLARRKSAGSASGYEQARLSIECELGRSHLAEARASLASDQAWLAALLGQPRGALLIEADLTLISLEKEGALARTESVGQESLGLSQESERHASRASERAAWAWFPTFELGAGLKRANNAGSADGLGYFVGANMGLPFFDRGQGQRAQAEAARVLSSARSDALSRRISLQVEVAALTLRRAREELERFEKATATHLEKLLRAAQAGYREGERSVVELLDAQRAQTEVALRRLSLHIEAKRAETRLRSAAGELK